MVYRSRFSGPSFPSSIEHQRPLRVAFVRVALKRASNSSWLNFGFSAAFGFELSCAPATNATNPIRQTAIAFMAQISPRRRLTQDRFAPQLVLQPEPPDHP